jgi:hypothetical protein
MRDVRFRGLDINGVWHYGLLSVSQGYGGQPEKGAYISNAAGQPWAFHVQTRTVGAFAGIVDKNGLAVYEGDIFVIRQYPFYSEGNHNYSGVIVYDDDPDFLAWTYEMYRVSDRVSGRAVGGNLAGLHKSDLIVIGNVHQHPELLQVGSHEDTVKLTPDFRNDGKYQFIIGRTGWGNPECVHLTFQEIEARLVDKYGPGTLTDDGERLIFRRKQ